MDLNDPRRRLQVLNASSPSIRVATAPTQNINVGVAQPQNLTIGTPVQDTRPLTVTGVNGSEAVAPTHHDTPLEGLIRGIGNFAAGANDEFLGGTNKAIVNTINWVGSGFNADEAAKRTQDFLHSTGQVDANGNYMSSAQGDDRNSLAFKFGQGVGGAEKLATDVATAAIPGAAAEKVLSGTMKAQKLLQGAGLLDKAANVAIPAVGGGLVSSGINQIQDPTQNLGTNLGTGAALDTGLSLLGPVGSAVGRTGFGGKVADAFSSVKNFFKGGDNSVVKSITNAGNPEIIKNALNVPDDIASYLASEKNPEVIKEVLKEIAVDPNIQIPDSIRQRLQDEGVTAVRQKDNPYGAEYNPADQSIDVASQADATPDNLYHELGHQIYATKLTPEEKALFDNVNGPARKEATGRPGYTNADLASEDFSDMMRKALTGKLDEVPEELRPVIEKYAKVAAQDPQMASQIAKDATAPAAPKTDATAGLNDLADTVVHIPGVGHTKITKDQAAILKDEVNNIPWSAEDRPHLTAGDKVTQTTKELSREELAQVSPNAAKALDNADAKIAAKAEEVGKAQTGTADGTVADNGNVESLIGKETTPEDVQKVLDGATTDTPVENGVKFRDPETKKTIQRSYEDVQQELDTLKAKTDLTPEDNKRIQTLETKLAQHRSANAKYAFPDATPDTQKAIQEVMDQLSPAERQFNKAQKAQSAEKAARINQAGDNFAAAGGGEQGFRAKLAALKGSYKESDFHPITASEETQNTLLNDIEKSNLRDFEKLNTQNALRKIWGQTEGKPTKSDINYIRKYFGEDMAKAVDSAVEEGGKDWRAKLTDIAGLPRAAMASFDLSMGLRQGGQVAVRNFPQWVEANKESVKYAANAKYMEKEMNKIANDDAYETIADQLGVRLPAVNKHSDEVMASAHILEKIPLYGKGVEASDRAYSGGLTKLRFNIAKQWIDSLGGIDEFNKNFSKKEMQDIGEVINTSTGSGGKKGGFTEKNMNTLATTLFAPRLWASRLNTMNPVYYARLSPVARKRAVENMASFLAAASTVVGLAGAAGAEVSMDPRSSDFMKIKVGNTRFDVFGGLQQNVVFFARMATGEKINSSTGQPETLGDGFGKPTRFDLASDMAQNKLNPLLGFAARLLQSGDAGTGNPLDRKDRFGQPMNVGTETAKLGIPLGIQGLADTYNDTGDVGKSIALNVPAFVGVGAQTYGNTATKDQGKDSTGKLAFKGKITDDMVLGTDGHPLLDAKGKPIKVKYPDGATDLEKKAIMDEKRNSALTAEFTNSQSKEDQAMMKLSGDQLQSYLDNGTIDQEKFDHIQNLQKGAQTYGRPIKVPKGADSEPAKNFYKQWNSMDKKDQEAWLKQAPDDNAKTVATLLNKERSEGLSEYKPSNELSKAYAEYEKDINTHPEYTVVDKRNKAKAFQTYAYKLNYSNDQRDIFAEGGSSDLKTLIDNKQISKDDLDAAIKMDNELYASGLTGSLKFTKKFRNTYGYETPAGAGGSGSGTRGLRADGSKKNQSGHLSDYLPSASTGKSTPAPQISAKRRTTGISFKDVSTPKKSNSKKVTINL